MVLSHAPKFCSNISISYKVLTQCSVWKVWCINGDEWQWMDVWWKLKEGRIEVGRKLDGCGIKAKHMSNRKWMNIKRKLDGRRTKNGKMSDGSRMKIRQKTLEWQNGKIVESWNGKTAQSQKHGITKPRNHGMAKRNVMGLGYNWLWRDGRWLRLLTTMVISYVIDALLWTWHRRSPMNSTTMESDDAIDVVL